MSNKKLLVRTQNKNLENILTRLDVLDYNLDMLIKKYERNPNRQCFYDFEGSVEYMQPPIGTSTEPTPPPPSLPPEAIGVPVFFNNRGMDGVSLQMLKTDVIDNQELVEDINEKIFTMNKKILRIL